jgi:hypothetical protein
VSTADAVAREVAWLTTTGDSLPSLLADDGGPWTVIQAYWPRTPNTQQTGIYVMRRRVQTSRFSAQRRMRHYAFRLRLLWPLGATTTGTPLLETEQANLDAAVDLLIARVEGFLGDHTHGGRFLSVAEAPNNTSIDVDFDDPEQTIPADGRLSATVTYGADDPDYTL